MHHAHTKKPCATASGKTIVPCARHVSRQPALRKVSTAATAAAAAAVAAPVSRQARDLSLGNSISGLHGCTTSQYQASGTRAVHCHSSSTQTPKQQQQEQQQRPIQVSINSTSSGVAGAVLYRLQHFGSAEVWATSAANHYTAIASLAQAQQQLQDEPLQSKQQPDQQLLALAATARLTAHDQPYKDDQKRRLQKLTLQVEPAGQIDPALLTPGQPGAISTNRIPGVPDVLSLMRQQLLEPQADGASSWVKPGAVCVVEARGEQAVCRALKAALSLQAAAGQALVLRPVSGQIVDVVAEKRGEQRLANGLLLLLSWD